VWEATVHLIPKGGAVAVARANHPGRYISLVVGADNRLVALVKIARDSVGADALRREGRALDRWGPLLPAPLFAPRVLERTDRALVLEPVEWMARMAPWRMSDAVAHGLGAFFRATASAESPTLGLAHGDCAPWNLLQTQRGWALIDWENAEEGAPPFFDLFHFYVQSSAELRRPSKRSIIEGLELKGAVGRAVNAYAAGCGVDPREVRGLFSQYLKRSVAKVIPGAPRRALRIRRQLAGMVGHEIRG
jgi:hypothetical protein